jgi:lipopolysaccharide transport system ATP-binding protein
LKDQSWIKQNEELGKVAYYKEVQINLNGNQPNLVLEVAFELQLSKNCKPSFVAFDIKNSLGVVIMQAIPQIQPFIQFSDHSKFSCYIDLIGIIPGKYTLSCWLGPHNSETYDVLEDIVSFDIVDGPIKGRSYPYSLEHGSIVPHSRIS